MKNLVAGICLIGVLGHFDHTRSGQLVLKDAKLIIELMSGDIVIIPSGAITHYNIPIRRSGVIHPLTQEPLIGDEWRSSIVQYTAGGLLRWIWHGNRKAPAGKKKRAQKDAEDAEGDGRWKELWDLFPTRADFLKAVTTGHMPTAGLTTKINNGESLLMPPHPQA